MDYPIRFDFNEAEARLYRTWEERGYFHARADSPREPYTIVIPPPNITGSLHMGHALNNSLQDLLIRFWRMRGREALYVPGTDHAGIATQFKVEQQLKKEENRTRFDVGRDEFQQRVWKWREQYGNTILRQLRRMGFSCDWKRTRFTLDPAYARAVLTAFVRLYDEGLIQRKKRLVNWCPGCKTSLSDLEAEKKDTEGHLWYIRYPFEDGSGHITVGTTRPETLLGDTAVACHPGDDRYKRWVGARLILPVLKRRIPIVADGFVDPKFGTGLVKVTPAHDPFDFECGQRHGLPLVQVIDAAGKMTAEAGPNYAGLDRFEARKKILKQLETEGLLEKVEPHTVPLARCYRCQTVLEPYLSDQWFVLMEALAKPALAAVDSGDIRFVPERYAATFRDWMTNIKDWCVSRQLWWGHRIPIFYCDACGAKTAAVDPPVVCAKCRGGAALRQDEDVLDTWFSSALWPFATLGWPDETSDLKKFYPTDVLVTSRDIINLWVARMIFMGLKFLGRRPFREVVIHAQLQTIEGKRMSKSLGTGIDPLELLDEYGADALRYCLVEKCTGMQDIRFGLPHEYVRKLGGTPEGKDDRSMIEARNFITKVWNACRFVLTNVAKDPGPPPAAPGDGPVLPPPPLEDRWILSKLNSTIRETTRDLESHEFGRAAQRLFHFTWDDFCDTYIELSKKRIQDPKTQAVLVEAIDVILRLLHPICPFVSDEIWRKLREAAPGAAARAEESVMIASWPAADERRIHAELESNFDLILHLVRTVRAKRIQWRKPPKEVLEITYLRCKDEDCLNASVSVLPALTHTVVKNAVRSFPSGSHPEKYCVLGDPKLVALLPYPDRAVDLDALKKNRDKIRAKLESESSGDQERLKSQLKEIEEEIELFESLE